MDDLIVWLLLLSSTIMVTVGAAAGLKSKPRWVLRATGAYLILAVIYVAVS